MLGHPLHLEQSEPPFIADTQEAGGAAMVLYDNVPGKEFPKSEQPAQEPIRQVSPLVVVLLLPLVLISCEAALRRR